MFSRTRTTREEAYQALFDLVKQLQLPSNAQWGIQSRGIKAADEINPADQPAMFLSQGPERSSKRRDTGATSWEWWAALVVYFRTDVNPVKEDWEYANAILESLDTLLWHPDGVQMLGGTVADCFIEGEISLFPEPEQTQQQTLVVPIVMLLGD